MSSLVVLPTIDDSLHALFKMAGVAVGCYVIIQCWVQALQVAVCMYLLLVANAAGSCFFAKADLAEATGSFSLLACSGLWAGAASVGCSCTCRMALERNWLLTAELHDWHLCGIYQVIRTSSP